MRRFVLITAILLTVAFCRVTYAQTDTPLNVALKTLGGEQLWSDQLVYGKWRIQRNELTGHFRLLDPSDVRRAWGDEQQCRAALDSLKRTAAAPLLDGKAVVTLHGLGRSRDHMNGMGAYLEKQGGYTWINVSYASTRGALDDHAESLASVIEGLDGIDEIHIVCHSLGNLVVRRYLGEATQPQPRWQPDPRIARMVMIGPPNNGAQMARVAADLLHDNQILRLITGASAWQLARQWDDVQKELATPGFPFGIIAGGFGDRGLNPLLEGDDDLLVTVAETRLPGATDFRLVNCRHGGLLHDQIVHQHTLNFFEHGCFTTAAEHRASRFRSLNRFRESLDPLNASGSNTLSTPLPRQGRLAAIDFGTVRLGVAITDPDQRLASPLENYTRRSAVLDAKWLTELAVAERIVGFVIGLPVHVSGDESQKSTEARKFGEWVAKVTGLPITFFDERYTSAHAEALLLDAELTKKRRKERLDKLAAQILLAAYLESDRSGEAPGPIEN